MFCPKCKSEYREGYKRCAACDIGLVETLPVDPDPEYVDLATVFEGDTNSAAVAKGKVESAGLEAWIRHEAGMSVFPSLEPAVVLVRAEDKEAALEALSVEEAG